MLPSDRGPEFLVRPSRSGFTPMSEVAVDSLMNARPVGIVFIKISLPDDTADDRFAVLQSMMFTRAVPGFVDSFTAYFMSAQIVSVIMMELALEPANSGAFTIISNRSGF